MILVVTLFLDLLPSLLMTFSNLFGISAIDPDNLSSISSYICFSSSSTSILNATLLLLFSDLSLIVISKVSSEMINLSTLIVLTSCASLMTVTFMSYLLRRDMRIFLANFSFDIFSTRANELLTMLPRHILNLRMISSSDF